jgi:hypothetical protein
MSVTEIDLSEIVSAVKSKKGKRVKKVVVEEVVDEVKETVEEEVVEGEGVEAVVEKVVETAEPADESVTTLVEEPVKVDKVKKAPTEKQLAARERARVKREEVKRLAEEAVKAEALRVAAEEAKKAEKKRLAAEKRAEKRKLAAMEEVEEVEEPVLVRAVVKPERTPKVVKVRPDVKPSFNTYVRKAREVEREAEPVEEEPVRDFGVVVFGDRAPAYRKRFF